MHVTAPTTHSQRDRSSLFAYERLDAYRVAVEFLEVAEPFVRQLPKTKGQLGDQLARASEGIILRIAEGTGAEYRSADQKRTFRSARGAAMECAAVLDICRVRHVGATEQITRGRALLLRLVQMLSRLARDK